MYCKHCGNQIDDDSKFCINCGKTVSGAKPNNSTGATSTPTSPQKPISAPTQTAAPKKNTDIAVKIKMLIAAALCVVLLLTPLMKLFSTQYYPINYRSPDTYGSSEMEKTYYIDGSPNEHKVSQVNLIKQIYYRLRISTYQHGKDINSAQELVDEAKQQLSELSIDDFDMYSDPEYEYDQAFDSLQSNIEFDERELENIKSEKGLPLFWAIIITSSISILIIISCLLNLYVMWQNFSTVNTYQNTYWVQISKIATKALVSFIICFVSLKIITSIEYDYDNCYVSNWMYDDSFWNFNFNIWFYIIVAATVALKIFANSEAGKCAFSSSAPKDSWVCSCGKRNNAGKKFCKSCGKEKQGN